MHIPLITEQKGHLSDAILVPSPPKSASQTLAELISISTEFPVVRPKSHGGIGHLVITIPPISRLEKIKKIASPRTGRHADIIYGHFPASRYNLKQLHRRYRIRACAIPVRPIGATLCSLVNHTRTRKGPLDPKILELTEGLNEFHGLNTSEAFFLLALRYLGPMQTIIEGWARTCIAKDIKLIVFPFESTISRQQEIASCLPKMAGLTPEEIRESRLQKPARENLSKGPKASLNEIDRSTLKEVSRMAAAIFRSDANPESLRAIFDYLLSDLSQDACLEQSLSAPLAWKIV